MAPSEQHQFRILVEAPDCADLEHADLIEESDWAADSGASSSRPARIAPKLGLAASVLLVAALGFMAVRRHAQAKGPVDANPDAGVGLSLAGFEAAAETLQSIGTVGANVETAATLIEETNFTKIYLTTKDVLDKIKGLRGKSLTGRNNSLQDGNPCPDDEESFGGLCYQTCTTLTAGKFPIRTTAFSCCMNEPCSFFNSKFSSPLHYCQGFDVGGHDTYGCPHGPGDCLVNEEFQMGSCYKMCAVLTDGEYPYRSSADSCCSKNDYVECLDPQNYVSDATFDVGGGDEELGEELGQVHPPIPALAEEQAA
jgi:hypothetical protein